MNPVKSPSLVEKVFIDRDKLYSMLQEKPPTRSRLQEILNKALLLKGLSQREAAELLLVEDHEGIRMMMEAARIVKQEIYGRRLVLFAPLYIANACDNNCVYCGFRKANTRLKRVVLSIPEVEHEVTALLRQGHKRLLMLTGESEESPLDYFIEGLRAAYRVRVGAHNIRRINVEIAPLDVEGFRRLKAEHIGTYTCFQETYDPVLYRKYHPSGPKSDYEWRLLVMDRAMEAGIDDVGIGALFGLADYRFEVLALLEHARHLEETFGCGPHTVSVPRIEPAEGAPLSTSPPHPVSDEDFKKLVAVIRLSLPYTGIILTTREREELRNELFHYGVSQISAGSRTNPGAYDDHDHPDSGAQFSLGDHRSLEEVISCLIDQGYIPSFCTGCYRKGRVGVDFMDLAKPGLIKAFCLPNALFTFKEYLEDFASEDVRRRGDALIERLVREEVPEHRKEHTWEGLARVAQGERDVYL
ncbi:biotin and thiamin synthesis associated [Spirochaeta thermophila DSM 6578]|uniref:Biotin and thiamin synthesis associated n=1 Tax=Winmispira thermophila (strain ATCC 700085 / DSM 6578 / Z-1203) TaxID=869211 RepID=G0GF67_WINT7|nr:[FeFe] hydrogenase H-cluster radical SAM maturase HydG [Spirochaeta thermophila]AEJ60766.1 biotin and thiamin synthesis associated [Spirochaeta thermophila DSM 6578]